MKRVILILLLLSSVNLFANDYYIGINTGALLPSSHYKDAETSFLYGNTIGMIYENNVILSFDMNKSYFKYTVKYEGYYDKNHSESIIKDYNEFALNMNFIVYHTVINPFAGISFFHIINKYDINSVNGNKHDINTESAISINTGFLYRTDKILIMLNNQFKFYDGFIDDPDAYKNNTDNILLTIAYLF